MGAILSCICPTYKLQVLMLGLSNAGKTTIFYKLIQSSESMPVMPTVGFNVESITYKNILFHISDVGGLDKIHPFWRYYYTGTEALIFVIDSTDVERMYEARDSLYRVIADRAMLHVPILILANKQDCQNGCLLTASQQHIRKIGYGVLGQ